MIPRRISEAMNNELETDSRFTRRQFAALAGTTFASFAFGNACSLDTELARAQANDGRLTARPRSEIATSTEKRRALGLGSGRDGILQLPTTTSQAPFPLLVLLHGAGGNGEGMLRRLGAAADEAGVAVLAPDSRDATWDAVRAGFGRDVMFLDRALERAFATMSVDPARIAVGGFSDGATYALSLGLINGDLFRRVIAFSPGFLVDGPPHGKPPLFISHGTTDPVLPIASCSRVIVPALRTRGYDVTFREFDGGHTIPPTIARDAMRWAAAI
jgi:phospholipase/carboxylesterase